MRDRDGLSPGDLGDPVADSIRNEQMADAAPREQPDPEPVECEECGVTREYGDGIGHRRPLSLDCPAVQPPPQGAERVLCDDCAEARESPETKSRRRARERYDDGFAVFECGNLTPFETPDDPRTKPYMPARCRCGAEVADVVYLADG